MPRRETGRGFSLSQVTTSTLNNTTTETSLFTTTIPAGSMGSSKRLNLNVLCTLTTPAVSVPSITVKLKLGSASLTIISSVGLAGMQTNTPFIIEAVIRNRDVANTQIIYAKVTQAASNVPMLIDSSKAAFAVWNVDTATDQPLFITAQFGGLSLGTSLVTQDLDIDMS